MCVCARARACAHNDTSAHTQVKPVGSLFYNEPAALFRFSKGFVHRIHRNQGTRFIKNGFPTDGFPKESGVTGQASPQNSSSSRRWRGVEVAEIRQESNPPKFISDFLLAPPAPFIWACQLQQIKSRDGGAWVAQSVKRRLQPQEFQPPSDFGSGHDLTVHEFEPRHWALY